MKDVLYYVSGLSENKDDYAQNYEIICAAIENCKKNKYQGILLPKGSYAIYSEKAVALYRQLLTGEIAATDYTRWIAEQNIVFRVSNEEHFSIIGNQTELLFYGLTGAIEFSNVRNARIEGVVIDWLCPLYFTAEVEEIENNEVFIRTNAKLTGGEPIVSFQNFDLKNGKQKGMCVFEGVSNVNRGNDGEFSFYSEDVCGLNVGDGIIARYIYNFMPVIHFYDCGEVTVEDVTVHSGCGMGVVAHKCGNIRLDRYRNVPKANRRMSTNVDATHFISCYGQIHFDHCEFEGMGDDAVNVHGFYMTIRQLIDKHTAVVVIEAASQDGIMSVPDVGDEVEFSKRETLLPFSKNRIADVKVNEEKSEMILKFESDISIATTVGDCIGNISKVASLVVENCTVRNIRGRAMLVQTRDVVIKNNLFEDCTGQGVHIDTATGWWESIGTKNVQVCLNKFINCGYGITKYCDAVGVMIEVEAEKTVAGVHKNITIQDNYIQGKNVGIKATGTEGLFMKGNVFSNCTKEYEISCCKDVKIVREEEVNESTM